MPSKKTRVAFLLVALAALVWVFTLQRPPPPPDWDETLRVVIYPYNADGSEVVAGYIETLTPDTFAPIEQFMTEQAEPHGLPVDRPFDLNLGPEITQAPTPPPRTGLLARSRWGLAVRWWHFRFRDQLNKPDIIVVARFHSPDELPRQMHSIAIAAQRLAVAKLAASEASAEYNNVVIAHEILHTVGASDLYHRETGRPRHPEGYADHDRQPRHPQDRAEIMAGRIPLTAFLSREATGLQETTIGETTAREIGWLDAGR
jgi:hypothetical protein